VTLHPHIRGLMVSPSGFGCPSDQRLCGVKSKSRPRCARFYYPRTPDIPNSELSEISHHASLLMDGHDRPSLFRGFGLRGFVRQRFRVHEIPDTPIPDLRWVLNGCHLSHRWTTLIVSGFSRLFPDDRCD
jgi:hypothetical protein